ncbi:hypothetical protein VUR80DRAFT_1650 [Thermomyces stellatus]
MAPFKIEIPIFTPLSSVPSLPPTARLELNAAGSYPSGGLTPPVPGTMPAPRPPVRVMIRPRGAPPSSPDFIYSPQELSSMLDSIRAFKAVLDPATDGFVFGVLEKSMQEGGGEGAGAKLDINTEANGRLVEEATPFGCTFHRAFDDALGAGLTVRDAVRDVLACGFDGILTSGGPGNAVDNLGVVKEIVDAVDGRMDVLVGGGVRAANAARILEAVGSAERIWLHSSCLRKGTDEIDEEELRALAAAAGQ